MKKSLIKWYRLIRYGHITTVNEVIDLPWGVMEMSLRDRWGRVVGYWAYGSYDPNLPISDDNYVWKRGTPR